MRSIEKKCKSKEDLEHKIIKVKEIADQFKKLHLNFIYIKKNIPLSKILSKKNNRRSKKENPERY